VTQNSVGDGEVLVISMPRKRKRFCNAVPVCVLLRKMEVHVYNVWHNRDEKTPFSQQMTGVFWAHKPTARVVELHSSTKAWYEMLKY
jgi:hypothetical protein